MAYYTTWEYILFGLAAFVFTVTLLCVLFTCCDGNDNYYKSSDEYLEYTSDTENEDDDIKIQEKNNSSSHIKYDIV